MWQKLAIFTPDRVPDASRLAFTEYRSHQRLSHQPGGDGGHAGGPPGQLDEGHLLHHRAVHRGHRRLSAAQGKASCGGLVKKFPDHWFHRWLGAVRGRSSCGGLSKIRRFQSIGAGRRWSDKAGLAEQSQNLPYTGDWPTANFAAAKPQAVRTHWHMWSFRWSLLSLRWRWRKRNVPWLCNNTTHCEALRYTGNSLTFMSKRYTGI